jgi:TolB protein
VNPPVTPPSTRPKRLRARLIASFALLLLALGAVIAGFVASRLNTTSIPAGAPSGELTFISDRDGNWDIFALDAAGDLRNLTGGYADGADDYFASWDFASERINFLSGRVGELGPTQVYPDGSNLRTLGVIDAVTTMFFESRFDWDAQWSPAGDGSLVFASLRDLNLEIYVADAADVRTRLTEHPGRDWFAAWSPDGRRIAFNSDREGDENLYVMDADGGNLRQITDHPADDLRAAWSLDGATLLFVSERQTDLLTGQMDLFVVPVAGGEADVRPLAAGEVFEGGAVWSADGGELAFMSNRDGAWHLYARDADGANLRQLTTGDSDHLFPVWRP